MKPGDTAKLIGMPPNLRDDADLQTRGDFSSTIDKLSGSLTIPPWRR